MSRESYEMSEAAFWDSELPRGAGDPDWYGYPGQPKPGKAKVSEPVKPEPPKAPPF